MNTIHPCRCCLLRPPDKNLKKPYTRFGKTEIYSDMIKECFEIQLTLDNDNACGICEVCVSRLRDASDFKLQVQRSQAELQAQLEVAVEFKAEPSIKTEIDNVKSDDDTDDFSSERAVETETGDMNVEAEYLFIALNEAASDSCKSELREPSVSESQLAMAAAREERLRGNKAPHSCLLSHETCHSEAEFSAAMTMTDCNDSQQGKPDKTRDVPSKKDTFKCDICGKQFANKSQSIKHLKDHTGQQTVSRKTCTKKIHNKDIFSQCKTSHTGQITYECNVCEQQTTSKIGLISHMRVHTKRYKLKPDSRKLIHTSKQNHSCEFRDKKFREKSTLRHHEKTHATEKPLVDSQKHKQILTDELYCCDVCGNQFRDKFNLIRHIKWHNEKKLFDCNICEKQFRKKDNLTRHIAMHMGLQPYGCQICGQRYDDAKSLRRCKEYHTREKPYPCGICHKRFSEKHYLEEHTRIHTGEKPYCCEVCGRKFSHNANFRTHLKIHVKGYTFSCELCPKFYSTKEGLRQHRRVHLGKKSSQKKVKSTKTKSF